MDTSFKECIRADCGGANTVVGCDNVVTKCYPYFKLKEKEEKRNVSVYFRLQQPHQSSKKSSDVSEIYLANKLSIHRQDDAGVKQGEKNMISVFHKQEL